VRISVGLRPMPSTPQAVSDVASGGMGEWAIRIGECAHWRMPLFAALARLLACGPSLAKKHRRTTNGGSKWDSSSTT
jgi:hypothetical protein